MMCWKRLVLTFGLVFAIACATHLVGKTVYGGMWPRCTTYHAPCNTWTNLLVSCCWNVGGFQTNQPTGQTLSAIPVAGGAQCGALFTWYYLIPCGQNIGGCGGAQHSTLCS